MLILDSMCVSHRIIYRSSNFRFFCFTSLSFVAFHRAVSFKGNHPSQETSIAAVAEKMMIKSNDFMYVLYNSIS